MEIKLIEERMKRYDASSKEEELNAFKEIAQEIALSALSRTSFFKIAGFQGGTALRILHGLNRFSEDLDFVLFQPSMEFQWEQFFEEIRLEFKGFGFHVEVKDRSKVDSAVKKAFLKQDSFGQSLTLVYDRSRSDSKVVTIKLEVDTNPPEGSTFESKVLQFPEPFSIVAQDLSSLFSGKLHALLCREYIKGRDWFDFIWYTSRQTPINLNLLQHALFQMGPWKEQSLQLDHKWLLQALRTKVREIDWGAVKKDVLPFIRNRQQRTIELWNSEFMLAAVDSMRHE